MQPIAPEGAEGSPWRRPGLSSSWTVAGCTWAKLCRWVTICVPIWVVPSVRSALSSVLTGGLNAWTRTTVRYICCFNWKKGGLLLEMTSGLLTAAWEASILLKQTPPEIIPLHAGSSSANMQTHQFPAFLPYKFGKETEQQIPLPGAGRAWAHVTPVWICGLRHIWLKSWNWSPSKAGLLTGGAALSCAGKVWNDHNICYNLFFLHTLVTPQ